MLFATGWVVVRSSQTSYLTVSRHGPHSDLDLDDVERVDIEVDEADDKLFDKLEEYLQLHEPPDLEWHFRRRVNHASGLLHFHSSRNHRGREPTAVALLKWLADHGPDSFGLVYVHDDEDTARDADHSNAFRAWRLMQGTVDELDDPFFSPIIPNLDPTDWA